MHAAWITLLVLATMAPVESQAACDGGSGLRLYHGDAMSYCFADDRMHGAPLTCVAVPYLEDAHVFAFDSGDDACGDGARATLPTAPTSLSIIGTPTVATPTHNNTARLCRPDPVTGRVTCPTDAGDDGTAPWLWVVAKVGGGANNTDGGLYSGDLVTVRWLLGGASACGLVDNVLVCDGTAPSSVFHVVV
ncbi:hypothetical protein pdul_cds_641 [Pandoravirus dulcis]|uniref:Uncharacterized protein n=1 Tax=Pandoravirus dulcis TaxID=1349409 RepID=S4VY07_9VIRU|nr:hypothetical protein pdul_cds_641 [Pandoravirus dulcis]AGO82779.1 hypothetical protein pdul_cds_641 [Pandoravirus dulcis]